MANVSPTSFHIEHYDSKRKGKKRPTRRYRAVAYVGKREGGPRRETTSWRLTREEAKADGAEMIRSLSRPPTTDETLAELLERWMRDHVSGLEATTQIHYRRIIDDHIVGVDVRTEATPIAMGELPAADLTASDVAEWQAEVLTDHAPKSVRNYRGVLSGALAWAVSLGDLQVNVVTMVKAPKWKRRPVDPPMISAMQDYLTVLEGTRYWLPVIIAGGLGMRRGEVLGLEWRHVDLERGVVHVRQNVRQVGSLVDTVPYLKTSAGRRDLPLPSFVAEKLRQALIEARLQGRYGPMERVCEPMKPDRLTHGLRAMYRRRGMKPIGMHMLRHAVASAMLASGVPVLEVQAFLGHKHASTTLGTYGHLLPGGLTAAAERYGQAWEEAESERETATRHQSNTKTVGQVVDLGSRRR